MVLTKKRSRSTSRFPFNPHYHQTIASNIQGADFKQVLITIKESTMNYKTKEKT